MFKKIVIIILFLMMSIVFGTVSSTTVTSPTASPYYTSNVTPTMTVLAVSNTSLLNATIFGNFTGSYVANATNASVISNNTAFNICTDTLIAGQYNWTVEVCDDENSCVRAGDMVLIVDVTDPTIGSVVNGNYSGTTDMTAQVNSTITETYKDSCWGKVYNATEAHTATIDGTLSGTTCMIDITATDTPTGHFTIGINANDSAGNTATEVNSTNWTKVTLYSGWNLVQVGANLSLSAIASQSDAITSTSYYYNSNHTYATYVSGASSNEDFTVEDGDAIYMYASSTINLLRFWSVDQPVKNITVTSGWNQIALQNETSNTLNQICDLTMDKDGATMNYATFVDMSASAGSQYISHPCALSVNNDTIVPKGYGVWVNVNDTTTMVLGRS